MQHLFAPHDLALKAKQNKFAEPCLAAYVEIATNKFEFMLDKLQQMDASIGLGPNLITAAPIYQQMIDWLKKEHHLYVFPFIQFEPKAKDDENDEEFLEEIYYVFDLEVLRETGDTILPYIKTGVIDQFDKGTLEDAIRYAFELVAIKQTSK